MSRLFVVVLLLSCSQMASAQSTDWLAEWLESHPLNAGSLQRLPAGADQPVSREQAEAAAKQLWQSRLAVLRETRSAEMEAREVVLGDLKMPFWYKVFGEKPAGGRSLFISMHGGGGAPARVNDAQYENQKKLYQPAEGVYLVPRAPTNTWNLWHQGHIDAFFDRLITNMVVFEDVNPNRVYFMGYSAGGDGVYQLAPRMADRLAAAAMMAGHPNETKPDGLRNIGFTLHMGGKDAAYKRNDIARQWKTTLAALRESDPQGYQHEVVIHEEFGHWMNRKDAVAIPWMAKFTRNPFPKKVVWRQDDVAHSRFYWLAVKDENRSERSRVVATVEGNVITITESDLSQLAVLLSDDLVNLDEPVQVRSGKTVVFSGSVNRTVRNIATSMLLRDDPLAAVSARIDVELPPRRENKAVQKGDLLFSDSFERDNLGDWKQIIPGFKVDDGVLVAAQEKADHGSVGRVYIPMTDVVMSFRFRLAGSPRFNVVFDDKNYKGSHAGHICRVAVARKQVRLGDDKEGIMRNDIFKMRRDPTQKQAAEKLLKGRGTSVKVNLTDDQWHSMMISIVGDVMRVSLDNEEIGTLKSPGLAHPSKESVHFTVSGKEAHFDDVKIWKAKK